MGCTPSVLVEDKHRDSNSNNSNGSCGASITGANPGPGSPGSGVAPRASLDSDGLGPPSKRSSVVNHTSAIGLFHTTATTLGLSKPKRVTGGSGSYPSGRLGHRKSSLALTPEDEPLDTSPKTRDDSLVGTLVPPAAKQLKLLLVFGSDDGVRQALAAGARRLGFATSVAGTAEEALDLYHQVLPDLVFIDVRNSLREFDPESVCRSIRSNKNSQHTIIIATVKKCLFEHEGITILPLLDAGFNRFWVESTNVNLCSNELLQLMYSDVRPQAQIATAQALYKALDRCRDLVHITDETHKVQYANRASERVLGFRREEIVGRPLIEPGGDDLSVMTNHVARNREWEGPITARRKQGDTIVLHSRVVPVCCDGRSPTHVVFIQDPPLGYAAAGEVVSAANPLMLPHREAVPRGSLNSLRRGSGYDVRSLGNDGIRKSSIAKLTAMPLEAPITKVIMMLNQVQDSCSPDVARQLERAQELLRHSELYSPSIKDDRARSMSDDPVAAELIGALLSQGPTHVLSSRRSSNDSTIVRNSTSASRMMGSRHHAPAKIRELLDTSLSWSFDIIRLEELSENRPLVYLGMKLACYFNLPEILNCDEVTIQNWFKVIESKYRGDNSYHNSTHAADVLQAIAVFLEKERIQALMEPIDVATCLLAAAAHDVDHPGRSSAFLCNTDDYLSLLYNDLCVLESHHSALTFQLTFKDDRVNIFKNLDRDTYKIARHNIIDMILATEMTKHFEHLAKFVNVFCTTPREDLYEAADMMTEQPLENPFILPENITLVKRMMIKCADVSNPARPLTQCVEWARRIAEEYFTQTDEEKRLGLPVVMPMFDRTTCSIPKSQIGFMDFIIQGMMEAWDVFIEMPVLMTNLNNNYRCWKEFEEQGVTTSEDVRQLQLTLHKDRRSTSLS